MKVKEESEKVGLKINIQKTKIMASSPITSWQIYGETMEAVTYFILGGAPKSLQIVTAAIKLKDTCSLEKKVMANLDSILKSRAINYFPTKVHLSSQSYGFSSTHVWIWNLDYKESWVPKTWCF